MSGSSSTTQSGDAAFTEIQNSTDYLNLRTYDVYDYFILIFVIIIFGSICLIIGCLWNKYLMKGKLIAINELDEAERRQNQFQNRDKYSIKSKSYSNKSNAKLSYSHRSNPNSTYDNQETEQLSPKGLSAKAYNVEKVNEQDGTIEIAVSLDRYN